MSLWFKIIVGIVFLLTVCLLIKIVMSQEDTLEEVRLESQQDLNGEEDDVFFEEITEEEKQRISEFEKARKSRVFYEDIKIITNPDCYLVLVNKNNALSPSYTPSDLVLPDVLNIYHQFNTTVFLRERAAHMLEKMFEAAFDEAGLTLLARSGYRSYQRQAGVHQRTINRYGQEVAEMLSARPGHSEHQAGLAIDITADSVNRQLVIGFGDTPEGIWLNQNAHRFGFILRYPLGREEDTGFQYEPWHFRYVGIESATEIFERDIILEEYLLQW